MSSLSITHRLAVISRVLAAIVGGYELTALAIAALAVFLPMPRGEAALAATMLSFAIYSSIVLWVFATRTAWRAWAGIALAALVLNVLLWLWRLLAGP